MSRGAVDIRNQSVYLETTQHERHGFRHEHHSRLSGKISGRGILPVFDFRLHNINIGKLVDFAPSLDTIGKAPPPVCMWATK